MKCGKGKGRIKDDTKEDKPKGSMNIKEINLVIKKCDAQDINVVTKPNEEFYDTKDTLALQSSLSAKLLVSVVKCHTLGF